MYLDYSERIYIYTPMIMMCVRYRHTRARAKKKENKMHNKNNQNAFTHITMKSNVTVKTIVMFRF